jgi:hypothetical protein
MDPGLPFCDIDGQYPESNYTPNKCIPTPSDCPVSRCGCTAGSDLSCADGSVTICNSDGSSSSVAACGLGCDVNGISCASCAPGSPLSCTNGNVTVCGSDGTSSSEVSCAIGCDIDGLDCATCTPGAGLACANNSATVCDADGRGSVAVFCGLGCNVSDTDCATFEVLNGLGSAFLDSRLSSAVVVSAGSTIDTDTGIVTDANGNKIPVSAVLIPQTGGPGIQVFEGSSFTINGATVVGSNAMAIASYGDVEITALLQLGANLFTPGPGATIGDAVCQGADQNVVCESAGGGASGYEGGNGGTDFQGNVAAAGGFGLSAVTPLTGGCSGGGVGGAGVGGAGGGALEIVSNSSVLVTGMISLGGGGGSPFGSAANDEGGGGGGGGYVIVQSPILNFFDAGNRGGVLAGGGAGGGDGVVGENGSDVDTDPALNLAVSGTGNGGANGNGGDGGSSQFTCAAGDSIGGGGGAGRVYFVTKDGTVSGTPIINAIVGGDSLTVQE